MKLRRRASGVVLLVSCALIAASCSSSSKAATPAPTTTPGTTTSGQATTAASVGACHRSHTAGQVAQSFIFQGKERTYQLYVPAAYKGTKRVPLVFDFHGFGSNAVQQMFYGNFEPEADHNDFLVVAPDGQDNGSSRHFSFGNEKGLQNDVTMVQSLLSHLEATLCIDATRVYSTGMSNGGAMTSVLACLAPTKFAAFAAVAVIIYCNPQAKLPVALASFQGTADPVVPYNGGPVHCCGGAPLGSKPVAMANWAKYDRCAPKYTDTRLGSEVIRRTWKDCAKGSTVVFYIIVGGGHTWPGSIPIARFGLTTQQINASAVIWKFFAAHKLAS